MQFLRRCSTITLERNVSLRRVIQVAATIKDVARATGLSIATISKYLNGGNVLENNKKLIEEAIVKLDFKVNQMARGLKTSHTQTVGILIPNLENIFCTSIISNIENILLQEGYSTIICDFKEDAGLETEKFEFLITKMVDGIVLMPLFSTAARINEAVAKGVPVVLIDRLIKGADCDVVLVDNLNASYQAVEQLIVLGHKRIGIVVGPKSIYTAQERLKGYLRVHEDYNLEVKEELIQYGDYDVQSGYDRFNQLLAGENPPTAVFVTNYEMTLGAVIAMNERNLKLPEELSFIGFDNLELARVVKPALSVVVQPMAQIGEIAAQLLLKRLREDLAGFPAMYRLKSDLLLKESVRQFSD
ncbi:LacI family transcriptional regulator [Hydrogenispora ethanolica]|uniref:LacI family transcriptional regulator n=1 Tax=Hydrogenispora ethanolica TaxID=1082276 RepID=A0A4R1SCF9_HYDET|nr:LacI family transcriptional regulator [Hydrogenispora ethanolica]